MRATNDVFYKLGQQTMGVDPYGFFIVLFRGYMAFFILFRGYMAFKGKRLYGF